MIIGESVSLLITNHLGIKPLKGGNPPKENNEINKADWVNLFNLTEVCESEEILKDHINKIKLIRIMEYERK